MSESKSKPKDSPKVSGAPEPIKPIGGSGYRGPASSWARKSGTAPNWEYWRYFPQAELWKVVALSCNIEPRESQFGSDVGDITRNPDWNFVDKNSHKDAFERLEIAAARIDEIGRAPNNIRTGYYTEVLLPRFAEWALLMGWQIPEEFKSMAKAADSKANQKSSDNNADVSTDRAHISDKLAYLNQAAQRFWANVKRDDAETHPKNADIAAWLIKNAGYSQTLADKAATIIRPEWAPTGRKPEE